MNQKRKRILCLGVCLAAAVVLIVLPAVSAAVSMNPSDNGGCFSVAFDKAAMRSADRAVICVNEERYEISDPALVREIADQTLAATNTDLRHPNTERWIELYRGDRLIRRMRWEDNHGGIVVYEADWLHWVFPSDSGEGLVYPSEELLAQLNALISAG